MNWRAIPNPPDGTSPYRARIVKDEGKEAVLVALFVTLIEAELVVRIVKAAQQ